MSDPQATEAKKNKTDTIPKIDSFIFPPSKEKPSRLRPLSYQTNDPQATGRKALANSPPVGRLTASLFRRAVVTPCAANTPVNASAVFAPCFIGTPPFAIVAFDKKHGAW